MMIENEPFPVEPSTLRSQAATPPNTDHRRVIPAWIARVVIALSATWLALATLSVVLASTIRRNAFHSESMPFQARLGLLCFELLLLAGAVVAGGIPLALIRWRDSSRRTVIRRLSITLFQVVLYAAVLLYAASWAAFWSWGHFLDLASVRFWLASPILLLQHVAQIEPWLLFAVPTAALGGTLLGSRLLTRIANLQGNGIRAIPILALGALGVAYWNSPAGEEIFERLGLQVWDPAVGTWFPLADHFAVSRDERTGPLSRVLADLRQLRAASTVPATSGTVEMTSRPLITMDEYLTGVEMPAVRPNVILVVIESLRSDQLRAYGAPQIVMPALEALSREGRVFRNHQTTATHSNYASVVPVSAHFPLRSARYHIYPDRPAYPRVMIYDILKEFGYRTAVVSSQNEVWGGMINYLQTGGIDELMHSENYDGPTYAPDDDMGFARFISEAKRAGKLDDRFTVQRAIDWIDRSDAAPFFMYMNLQNSHLPYLTPADFPRPFGTGQLSFPIRFNNFPPDSAEVVKAVYANSLAYVDHQLGKLFDHLKARRLWDQTIVVVTGDHGQAFFEHGFAAHGNQVYEELTRTPLVIRGPGIEPGIDDRPAQHVDIAPSLLDLIGLPLHPGHQGISLFAPTFAADRPSFVIVQTPMAHQYAVIRSGYKLIHDLRRRSYRLYDLRRDPYEMNDLVHELPELATSLRELLDAWSAAQIRYYTSQYQPGTYYPPVLSD